MYAKQSIAFVCSVFSFLFWGSLTHPVQHHVVSQLLIQLLAY